jgi:hypothetical protein
MEINEAPSTLEGKKVLGTALKITPSSSPKKFKGKRVFPVSIERRAEAEVLEQIAPKERFYDESMLKAGDKIAGHKLWGWSSSPLLKLRKGGAGKSGRHTGQECQLPDAVVSIVEGWRGLPAQPHPRDRPYLEAEKTYQLETEGDSSGVQNLAESKEGDLESADN